MIAFLSIVACLGALIEASSDAPRVGDVVVTIEPAEVRVDGRLVGYVDIGNVLVVTERSGERLRVNYVVPGWILRSTVAEPATAIERFSAALNDAPGRADLWLARGRARHAAGDIKNAIADLSAAVRLAPDDVRPRLMRSRAYETSGDLDEALADLNQGARLSPSDGQVFRLRAGLLVKLGRYSEALRDYNQAVRLNPSDAAVANDRAWLSATCPDARFRDGGQAVIDATFACEQSGWRTFNRLGTLAAAHAEAGQWSAAVRRQTESLALAPPTERRSAETRLKLYRFGKPYRDVPSTSTRAGGYALHVAN